MASESLEEDVWLFAKVKCDVVVCVRDRQEPRLPSRKRNFEVQVTDFQGEGDVATLEVEKKERNLLQSKSAHPV